MTFWLHGVETVIHNVSENHRGVHFGTPLPLTTQHLLDMTYYAACCMSKLRSRTTFSLCPINLLDNGLASGQMEHDEQAHSAAVRGQA